MKNHRNSTKIIKNSSKFIKISIKKINFRFHHQNFTKFTQKSLQSRFKKAIDTFPNFLIQLTTHARLNNSIFSMQTTKKKPQKKVQRKNKIEARKISNFTHELTLFFFAFVCFHFLIHNTKSFLPTYTARKCCC